MNDEPDTRVTASVCDEQLFMEINDKDGNQFSLLPHPDQPTKHVLYKNKKDDVKEDKQVSFTSFYTSFTGNSIFYPTRELLTKFLKTSLKVA